MFRYFTNVNIICISFFFSRLFHLNFSFLRTNDTIHYVFIYENKNLILFMCIFAILYLLVLFLFIIQGISSFRTFWPDIHKYVCISIGNALSYAHCLGCFAECCAKQLHNYTFSNSNRQIQIVPGQNFSLYHIRGFSQLRIARPPPLLQKWSHFNRRCVMCWNEWKINFPCLAIFIFWVIVDFVLEIRRRRWTNFEYINRPLSRKLKIGKLIFHSSQHIQHLSCKWLLFNFFVENILFF